MVKRNKLVVQHSVRLLQISDAHLFADPTARLLGLDTDVSFQAVVELALYHHRQTQVSAILATGDIAQDASQQSYQRYQQVVQQFNAPILWLPGNHDRLSVMRQCFAKTAALSPCVQHFGHWSVIMLDSSVQDEVYGFLSADNFDFLNSTLSQFKQQYHLVCVHHHPVLCGSAWLDQHNLRNADVLLELLGRHQNVKALVWAHIHQEFTTTFKQGQHNFVGYAPPSTCIQFKPHCDQFTLDTLNPGYRWFDLYPNGRLETGICRVQGSFNIDMQSRGY